jgi:hypothetical protein
VKQIEKNFWIVPWLCSREFLWPFSKHSVKFLRFHKKKKKKSTTISTTLCVRQTCVLSPATWNCHCFCTHQDVSLHLCYLELSRSQLSLCLAVFNSFLGYDLHIINLHILKIYNLTCLAYANTREPLTHHRVSISTTLNNFLVFPSFFLKWQYLYIFMGYNKTI